MLSPRGEEELEEGEARLDGDDQDSFDPDVALSYIDEKLQHVLGHFQKDFEGGVSADSLGPKFGGYGSFLPTYQHFPPLLPQTRSSHVASNISTERMDRNLSTVAVEFVSRNNDSIAPPTSDLYKNERCSSTNSEESVAGSDSLDSSFNGTDSKSLKVQMKVGSNDLLPRKNAANYCGLGLDISSSSSMEESPDGLGGLSPEFSNVPCESPQTILQVMTCFLVPGGFMLSPLRDNILQLTNEVAPLLKKWEAHCGMENVPSKEDQTTNALNALYVTPAPDIGVSSSGPRTAGEDIETLSAQSGQLEQSRKRKTAPSDGNGPIESSYYAPLETPSMSNQKNPSKQSRTVVDDNDNFDRDSLSKHDLRPMSKSADLVSQKLKSKYTSRNSYSEGEVLKERTKVHSKLKTNRGIDQDMFKKTRKEDQHQIKRVWDHECDSAGGEVAGEPFTAFPAKAKAVKGSLETGDISLSKEKISLGYDLSENSKKINDVELPIPREKKERSAYVERLDLSCKKKMMRKCKENQLNSLNTVSNGSKNKKENKSNILNPEEMMSKVDNSPGKIQHEDTGLPSSGKRLNHNLCTGKEGPPELQENIPSRQALDLAEPTRRDAAYLHSSTAAASSSSKFFNSWRNKNSQATKDSPVESVSSSPLRNLNVEKLCTEKDGTVNAYSGTVHSPVTCSRAEVCELDDGQQAGIVEESQAAEQPIFHGSFGGEEKSKSKIPNQDIQKPPAQDVHVPIKEGKQEVCSTSVKFDTSQMEVLSRRSNVQNGVQHATVRQAGSKPSGASPIGKDGNMVAFALKEARDLKHKANHLKNKGLELESTGLYFEAALKFLHVAFLLETPNFDSSRPDDAAQSMKMYSETAKLCKFCAHEYERSKKMAAAALAYKCVEVAYLKAAYYKNPSASKDRQELQAVVQLAPGIDNINGHGLSKVSSTKCGCSLQVAGNHLPLAVRSQEHLLRLLAYTNDVNGAFDATHKSQLAIVSATGDQEKKGVDDGLASVKTVLDFNFKNVNELLRLVRLSMESISL